MSDPRRVRTLRARYVSIGEGAPLADGFVACDGATIRAVGRWPQDRPTDAGDVTDLGSAIILPGLVNVHTHSATCPPLGERADRSPIGFGRS